MTSPIKPLADRVVAVREEAQTQTTSGLYLPESAKEKSIVANVIAVGPEATEVKAGDRILYKEYSTTEVKIDKTTYIVLKQEDILGTL